MGKNTKKKETKLTNLFKTSRVGQKCQTHFSTLPSSPKHKQERRKTLPTQTPKGLPPVQSSTQARMAHKIHRSTPLFTPNHAAMQQRYHTTKNKKINNAINTQRIF